MDDIGISLLQGHLTLFLPNNQERHPQAQYRWGSEGVFHHKYCYTSWHPVVRTICPADWSVSSCGHVNYSSVFGSGHRLTIVNHNLRSCSVVCIGMNNTKTDITTNTLWPRISSGRIDQTRTFGHLSKCPSLINSIRLVSDGSRRFWNTLHSRQCLKK